MDEHLVVSTMAYVPGYAVKEYRGLVWASTAKTTSLAKDLGMLAKTLTGGEAHAYKHLMAEARTEIVHELVEQAKKQGANGVLGVGFGSTPIQPGVLDVFAYGTAVILEKEKARKR